MRQHLRDVFGPALYGDVLPEGTTVGTSEQFVGFSIGYNGEHLLLPEEATKLAELLVEGAAKCRQRKTAP